MEQPDENVKIKESNEYIKESNEKLLQNPASMICSPNNCSRENLEINFGGLRQTLQKGFRNLSVDEFQTLTGKQQQSFENQDQVILLPAVSKTGVSFKKIVKSTIKNLVLPNVVNQDLATILNQVIPFWNIQNIEILSTSYNISRLFKNTKFCECYSLEDIQETMFVNNQSIQELQQEFEIRKFILFQDRDEIKMEDELTDKELETMIIIQAFFKELIGIKDSFLEVMNSESSMHSDFKVRASLVKKSVKLFNNNPIVNNSKNNLVAQHEIPVNYRAPYWYKFIRVMNNDVEMEMPNQHFLNFNFVCELLASHLRLDISVNCYSDDTEDLMSFSFRAEEKDQLWIGNHKYYVIKYRSSQELTKNIAIRSEFYLELDNEQYKQLLYPAEKLRVANYKDQVFAKCQSNFFKEKAFREVTQTKDMPYRFNGMQFSENQHMDHSSSRLQRKDNRQNIFNQSERIILMNNYIRKTFHLEVLQDNNIIMKRMLVHFKPESSILYKRQGSFCGPDLFRTFEFKEMTDVKDQFGQAVGQFAIYQNSYIKYLKRIFFQVTVLTMMQQSINQTFVKIGTQQEVIKYIQLISVIYTIFLNFNLTQTWQSDINEAHVRWGVKNMDHDTVAPIRPGFQGTPKIDKITGMIVYKIDHNLYQQISRIFNWLLLGLFIQTSFQTSTIIIYLPHLEQDQQTAIVTAVVVKVYNEIQRMVSLYSTRFENHETEESENQSYFLKLLIFQATNSYYPIFSYIFKVMRFPKTCDSNEFSGNCWYYIGYQLLLTYITFLLINIMMIVVPRLFYFNKLVVRMMQGVRSDPNSGHTDPTTKQIKDDFFKLEGMQFDRQILNSMIENGYMMLFGSTMPICWAVLLVNKMIETRLMLRDNSYYYRRVEPAVRQGLGQWGHLCSILMQTGCIVNQSILCFVSNSPSSNAPNNFSNLIQELIEQQLHFKVDDVIVKTLMFVVIQNFFVMFIIIVNSTSQATTPKTKLTELRANQALKTIEDKLINK